MKAVLFDLFGTLVDNPTVAQVGELHASVASVLEVSPEEFAHGWSVTFQERSSGAFGSVEGAIVVAAMKCSKPSAEGGLARAVRVRRDLTRGWLTPRKDAQSTLTEIRNRGFRTGLLSNCTQEVPELWSENILSTVIDVPLFSSIEFLRKPIPEFYERALARLNVPPAECLFVADGDNGELAAARRLGMPAVMIRPSDLLNDFRQTPEDDWDGPRIERLSELLLTEFIKV